MIDLIFAIRLIRENKVCVKKTGSTVYMSEHVHYTWVGSGEESGCSQYYTTSDQLLHVPHNNIITDELNYVCVYLPTDSRYAVTAV